MKPPRKPRAPGEMVKAGVEDPKVHCGTCQMFDGYTWCRHWNFFTTADSPPCRFYKARQPPPNQPRQGGDPP